MREFLVVPTPWSLEASMNEHVYILPSMPVFVQFGFPSPTPNLHETNTTYVNMLVLLTMSTLFTLLINMVRSTATH